jgi:Holliday junction resolvase RusA-like endonuclease|tara:strand:- start:19 stop:420 length:402 start_codon:yes stop_codon:yes gene_type:complete
MFLTVIGEPVSKGRPRFGRGKTYTPAKTIAAETFIQLCATQKGVPKMMNGPLRLTVTFSMGIPKSWSAKKKEEAELGNIRPTGKPDLDNLIKLVGDSLEKAGVYRNDSQIVEVKAVKKYGKPQTIIHIEEVIK